MIYAYYFRPGPFANFGDELVPIILRWISGDDVEWVNWRRAGKIMCIGSELASGIIKPNDVIWGYGSRRPGNNKPIILPDGVKVLAVRGPMTRKYIQGGCPEVYGDPAILMPLIYQPQPVLGHKIGIVPHYVDRQWFAGVPYHVIDVRRPPEAVIDEICACDIIMSTSLHGCIAAEAYGKPAIWLSVSDKVLGADFKFNDYFMGTGRDPQTPVKLEHVGQIERAMDYVLPPPIFNQQGLIDAWHTNAR